MNDNKLNDQKINKKKGKFDHNHDKEKEKKENISIGNKQEIIGNKQIKINKNINIK